MPNYSKESRSQASGLRGRGAAGMEGGGPGSEAPLRVPRPPPLRLSSFSSRPSFPGRGLSSGEVDVGDRGREKGRGVCASTAAFAAFLRGQEVAVNREVVAGGARPPLSPPRRRRPSYPRASRTRLARRPGRGRAARLYSPARGAAG